ncbi:hypothetical protein FB45DRAFT_1060876 [Roridomyces roridus]|uniref:Uncharacterized protein n=1 Tax=Roridomyces roridus TaxID=1738132 RepID=A0AAD7BLR0_9AGAR|nr:hypothetical protein FB45DRAFT_1060876 [Roridomyces roridus]
MRCEPIQCFQSPTFGRTPSYAYAPPGLSLYVRRLSRAIYQPQRHSYMPYGRPVRVAFLVPPSLPFGIPSRASTGPDSFHCVPRHSWAAMNGRAFSTELLCTLHERLPLCMNHP